MSCAAGSSRAGAAARGRLRVCWLRGRERGGGRGSGQEAAGSGWLAGEGRRTEAGAGARLIAGRGGAGASAVGGEMGFAEGGQHKRSQEHMLALSAVQGLGRLPGPLEAHQLPPSPSLPPTSFPLQHTRQKLKARLPSQASSTSSAGKSCTINITDLASAGPRASTRRSPWPQPPPPHQPQQAAGACTRARAPTAAASSAARGGCAGGCARAGARGCLWTGGVQRGAS